MPSARALVPRLSTSVVLLSLGLSLPLACGGDDAPTADPAGEGGSAGKGASGSAGVSAKGGTGGVSGSSGIGGSGGADAGAAGVGGTSGGSGSGGLSGGAGTLAAGGASGSGGAAAGGAGAGAGGAAFGHDPIVFVHGYAVDEGWWDPALKWFEENGYPKSHLRAAKFKDNVGSVLVQAKELDAIVEGLCKELGVNKVDILSHSMGGLTTRSYIKFENGKNRVRDYVSFGGAHHGTASSCAAPIGEGALQMCPTYSTKTNTVQYQLNGDPDQNDVDETPFGVEDGGGVTYSAFWSDGDLILSPNETACLNQAVKNDCSDAVNTLFKGVLHSQMNAHVGMLTEAKKRFQVNNP